MHTKAKKSNSELDWANFKAARKYIQVKLAASHTHYVNNIVDPSLKTSKELDKQGQYHSKDNNKGLWAYIKSKRQDSVGVSTLKANGIIATEAAEKATLLNSQFSSVFTRENIEDIPNLPESPHPQMPNITITCKGTQTLLEKLNASKATGPDELPARVLKEAAIQIAPMLSFIFQQSLDSGHVPVDWRSANVAPIFKKSDRSKPANYRPVSLTCISCKLLERIIVKNLLAHLESHNILVDNQHGFRSGRSCESQLIITTQDIASYLDKKQQVDAAVLDFSKAFDKVPHVRLHNKLSFYGIRGNNLDWITAFLSGQTQRVVVDGHTSPPADVLSGVPQGSVLGPVLFLLFINDIATNIDSHIRLFAGDCLLY